MSGNEVAQNIFDRPFSVEGFKAEHPGLFAPPHKSVPHKPRALTQKEEALVKRAHDAMQAAGIASQQADHSHPEHL